MIVVIGRGVLGLSVAEYLSRQGGHSVLVCFDDRFSLASAAAAANLSTKGQLYARDPHFELKLQSKAKYPDWLAAMVEELEERGQDWDYSSHYLHASGRDIFETKALADKQWDRITQPLNELKNRGFTRQPIERPSEVSIEYEDEAWVDALYLLQLLEAVCRSRGVQFLEKDIRDFSHLNNLGEEVTDIVLCAGGYSPHILEAWGCADALGGQGRKLRCSYGGTLCVKLPDRILPDGIALLEFINDNSPEKVTFSGTSHQLFASSVSIPCVYQSSFLNLGQSDRLNVERQKQVIRAVAENQLGLNIDSLNHEWRWGWRLGFGHRELLVERIAASPRGFKGRIVLAAGAHKSGFLFAPLIGSLVGQKLQSSLEQEELSSLQ
jgi:glycine/D-amino acid oxidase-like deaminating enzyme